MGDRVEWGPNKEEERWRGRRRDLIDPSILGRLLSLAADVVRAEFRLFF
jgi:hypothetical protein